MRKKIILIDLPQLVHCSKKFDFYQLSLNFHLEFDDTSELTSSVRYKEEIMTGTVVSREG